MTDKFEMNQGLGHQLEMALERNGWTRSLVNKATEGSFLASVLSVLEGRATIVPNKPLTKIAKAVTAALLVFVTTATVAATTAPFIAADKFVVNTKADAKVKISGLWSNFETYFLGKVEPAFGDSELKVQKLLQKSLHKPIIDELGGEAKSETSLTEMFALMEKQGHGQEGALLTNGWANIFYIRDVTEVLWAVYCDWDGGGWSCDAGSIENPDEWDADDRVVSHNSVAV